MEELGYGHRDLTLVSKNHNVRVIPAPIGWVFMMKHDLEMDFIFMFFFPKL